jgi:hypothetical protein
VSWSTSQFVPLEEPDEEPDDEPDEEPDDDPDDEEDDASFEEPSCDAASPELVPPPLEPLLLDDASSPTAPELELDVTSWVPPSLYVTSGKLHAPRQARASATGRAKRI